jgi:Reverse transcriptase (RNA-dependent DNA polymerase)
LIHGSPTNQREPVIEKSPTIQRETIELSSEKSPSQSSSSESTSSSSSPNILPKPTVDLTDSTSSPLLRRSSRSNKGIFSKSRYADEAYLTSTIDWQSYHGKLCYNTELNTCLHTDEIEVCDPRAYISKASLKRQNEDNPTIHQALNGPHSKEYVAAMKEEVETLVRQATWEEVPRPLNKPVLKGTWVFRLKRSPDGTPIRFKARFCARGDMQIEGVDFFETYAPVVQWSTIRLLLSTVLTENWYTKQVDYTNAFAQANLKEEVYIEYPRYFGPSTQNDFVLHLKKSLYGLRQAPRTFFEMLRSGLLERGWIQSKIDPCLFLKPGMMCVVYVDDTIFGGKSREDIDREIHSLGISTTQHVHTFTLRDEGSVNAFLGIHIKKVSPNCYHLTQHGLINKVLHATNMSDCNGCETPATLVPLHTDRNGVPFEDKWEYDSIIGMLMYLAGNTRPDISYAVHQAARFTHNPKKSHGDGIKRILRYLKKTKLEGLYLRPSEHFKIDCYVDADFAGLFSVEDKQDPVGVKSRTGYIILYRDAPLLWVSKLQTQIALSTMEAEYVALSQSMRDLIPIREILKEIMKFIFVREPTIQYRTHSKIFEEIPLNSEIVPNQIIPQSTVFEDNMACLKFACMPRITPRTKHIGIPYHWFRSKIENLEIIVERIDSGNQLADCFTKGLPPEPFKLARKRLLGW